MVRKKASIYSVIKRQKPQDIITAYLLNTEEGGANTRTLNFPTKRKHGNIHLLCTYSTLV
jgi:hypothetical protein